MAFASHTPHRSSTTGKPVRLHQRGTVPARLVAQHPPDLGQGSISQGAVETPLTGPTCGAHPGRVQRFDDHNLVLLGQPSGGLVQDITAHRRRAGMGAPDAGRSFAPPLRRSLSGLGDRIVGAVLAGGAAPQHPQPGLRGTQGLRCPDPVDLDPVGTRHDQQGIGFHPDIDTDHRVHRPACMRGSGLGGHDGLQRAVPAPGRWVRHRRRRSREATHHRQPTPVTTAPTPKATSRTHDRAHWITNAHTSATSSESPRQPVPRSPWRSASRLSGPVAIQ